MAKSRKPQAPDATELYQYITSHFDACVDSVTGRPYCTVKRKALEQTNSNGTPNPFYEPMLASEYNCWQAHEIRPDADCVLFAAATRMSLESGDQILAPARNVIAAITAFLAYRDSWPTQPVPMRHVRVGDDVWVDSGADFVWHISPSGVERRQEPPEGIVFRRTALTGTLITPDLSASWEDALDAYAALFPPVDGDLARLSLLWDAFVVAHPGQQTPIKVLVGPPDSGKSSMMTVDIMLLDNQPGGPHANKGFRLNSASTDRDILAASGVTHVMGLDNLSDIRDSSDILTSFVTGALPVSRKLFSDADVATYDVCKPAIINGVNLNGAKADLVSRFFQIPFDGQIVRRADYDAYRDMSLPIILGGMYRYVSQTLEVEHTIPAPQIETRLMAFAHWVSICDHIMGTNLLAVYDAAVRTSLTAKGEESPLYRRLMGLAADGAFERQPLWTMGDLYKKLSTSRAYRDGDTGLAIDSPRALAKAITNMRGPLAVSGLTYTNKLGSEKTGRGQYKYRKGSVLYRIDYKAPMLDALAGSEA